MKLRRLLSVSWLSLASLLTPAAQALVGPQDNWRAYANASWNVSGTPRSMAIRQNDEIYLALEAPGTGVNSIEVYSRSGAHLRTVVTLPSLGTNGRVVSMAFGPTGTLYVLSTDRLIRAYAANGSPNAQWGGSGTGSGSFGSIANASAWLLATDSAGHVYVADLANRLVQKFDSAGNFQAQWGGAGTLSGQFGTSGGMALGVTPQDKIVVASQSTTRFLQLFNPDGSAIATPNTTTTGTYPASNAVLAVSPDGLIAVNRVLSSMSLYDGGMALSGALPIMSGARLGFAFDSRGDYYIATSAANSTGTVTRYERSYTVDNPPAGNALPLPVLISTEQRPSTPYIDIDYKVVDADDPIVRVALLGFVEGGNDLSKVLKLSTFVEGTAARVGLGQTTNTVHRVTWNAAADWAVEFGDVQIEVLAQDPRDLLPIHWIGLPFQGNDPEIEISQRPVTDAEWMHLWYWLIAIGDPTIALANGQITGVGGDFDGQSLATTTDNVSATTAEGLNYLRAKCGVRALTVAEITRATSGQFGFSEVNEFSVARVSAPATATP